MTSRVRTRVSIDSSEFLQNSDVQNLITSGSFDNTTRTLTLEHNDATETLVQIPHTTTPNVDNLVKNISWNPTTRDLTVEKNSIYQTNSVLNIPHTPIPNVSNLIKTASFDNATRMLALGHNDADENGQNATATLVQIPHTPTDNLVKNVTWDSNTRNLTIEKNSIYQTNSVHNIAEADLTNYHTKTEIANFDYAQNNSDISPNNVRLRTNYKVLWDQHSDKGIWMQDSTWVRFDARILATSNKHICTQGTGRIGAGTTNPGQPLHVAGKAYISSGMHVAGAYWYNNYTDSQSDYLTRGGGVQANPPGLNFGIRCDQAIVCSYLVVTSDRRIKENIKDIEDDVALTQLRLLQPKTYTYKDKFEKGDKEVIGFIAQEVKEVLPNAVKLDKRAIPNILKQCSAYNKSKDVLELRLDSPMTNDITDKTIQIYVNDIPYIAKVIFCEDKVVQIKKPDEMADFDEKQVVSDGDKAILYGEYVDDFHVLDKSAIFTIATAAIQELDRQLQAEKMKTLSLERRIIALEQRL